MADVLVMRQAIFDGGLQYWKNRNLFVRCLGKGIIL